MKLHSVFYVDITHTFYLGTFSNPLIAEKRIKTHADLNGIPDFQDYNTIQTNLDSLKDIKL